MKIYRTAIRDDTNEHKGFIYDSNQKDAGISRATAKAEGGSAETMQIEVKLTKQGVISALNKFGGHPDNG